MLEIILIVLSLILLAIGSFTDLRSREVPDWLSYAGITIGALIHILWSLIVQDYHPLLEGMLGFGVFWLIGIIMYHTSQWGGGDAKILMALGTIMGVKLQLNDFMLSFLTNSFIVGAAYGLSWLVVLSLRNYTAMRTSFHSILAKEITLHWAGICGFVFFFGLGLVVPAELQASILLMGAWCLVFGYLFVWLRAVEESCMKKQIVPSQLTEGDWIAKEVIVQGKHICGPHYEGVTRKQIQLLKKLYLQGKIKHVLIKEGIPFVPNFLIAFVMTLLVGNLIFLLT